MNAQKIIDGYHAAEYKIAYIAKLSRDYKLPKSTIIAELFKSGYKYEEIIGHLHNIKKYDYILSKVLIDKEADRVAYNEIQKLKEYE